MTNKLNFDDFDPLPGHGGGGVCPSYARPGALGRQKRPCYGPTGRPTRTGAITFRRNLRKVGRPTRAGEKRVGFSRRREISMDALRARGRRAGTFEAQNYFK